MVGIGRDVLTGMLSAAAVGGLTLLWNWATQGGAIRALGGVTETEVKVLVKSLVPSPAPDSKEDAKPGGILPAGLVASFASQAEPSDTQKHCPVGWNPFEEARGRVLIGAGIPGKYGFDKWDQLQNDGKTILKRDLARYRPFEIGGEESHFLSVNEMPNHSHQYDSEFGTDGNRSGRQDATFGRMQAMTTAVGGNQAHNTLPPYIAVYYCIKG